MAQSNPGTRFAQVSLQNRKGGETNYYRTERLLFKWLNRRSQRLSYNWAGFKDLLKQFLIPVPKITEKYTSKTAEALCLTLVSV